MTLIDLIGMLIIIALTVISYTLCEAVLRPVERTFYRYYDKKGLRKAPCRKQE